MGHESDSLIQEDHFHHWRLSAPSHGVSHGVCKHCGAEQDFGEKIGEGNVNPRANIAPERMHPTLNPDLDKLLRLKIAGHTDEQVAMEMGFSTVEEFQKRRGMLLKAKRIGHNSEAGVLRGISNFAKGGLLDVESVAVPERMPARVNAIDTHVFAMSENAQSLDPFLQRLNFTREQIVNPAVEHIGAANLYEAMYIWGKLQAQELQKRTPR